MTSEPTVRQARGDEAGRLMEVLNRSFREYHGKLDPPSGVFSETLESLSGQASRGGALLCEVGNDLVGCAFCTQEAGYLYVGRFGVVPEWRRAGIGALLLRAAESRARELGYARVRLNVRMTLEGLRSYYERHGYVPLVYLTHEGYPGPTYVQMEKLLRS